MSENSVKCSSWFTKGEVDNFKLLDQWSETQDIQLLVIEDTITNDTGHKTMG